MTVQYTPNLKLNKPDTAHKPWDVELQALADLVDEALAGFLTKAITGNTTLTIPSGVTGEARHGVIKFTGALGADATITMPAIEKTWIIWNATTGGFKLSVGVSGQTLAEVAFGEVAFLFSDGTNTYSLIELQHVADIVVGSSAQVTSGKATHTVSNFVAAITAGNSIFILAGTHALIRDEDITESDVHIDGAPESLITNGTGFTLALSGARIQSKSVQYVFSASKQLILSGVDCFVQNAGYQVWTSYSITHTRARVEQPGIGQYWVTIPAGEFDHARPTGFLHMSIGDIGNVGSGQDLLHSYAMPLLTMIRTGEGLKVIAYGTGLIAKDTTLKFRFGGTDHTLHTGTGLGNWWVEAIIIRTSEDNQNLFIRFLDDNGGTFAIVIKTTVVEDESVGLTVQFSGQNNTDAVNNAVVQTAMNIQWMSAEGLG